MISGITAERTEPIQWNCWKLSMYSAMLNVNSNIDRLKIHDVQNGVRKMSPILSIPYTAFTRFHSIFHCGTTTHLPALP